MTTPTDPLKAAIEKKLDAMEQAAANRGYIGFLSHVTEMRALLSSLTAAQSAPQDYGTHHAIMEGECIAATEEYFKARQKFDDVGLRRIFEAGFQRGFEARHGAVGAPQDERETPFITDVMVHAFHDAVPIISDADEIRAGLRAALSSAQQGKQEPCKTCDDTGDVHRPDGEYIGKCKACAAPAQQSPEIDCLEFGPDGKLASATLIVRGERVGMDVRGEAKAAVNPLEILSKTIEDEKRAWANGDRKDAVSWALDDVLSRFKAASDRVFAPPQAEAEKTLSQIADMFNIGEFARDHATILTNVWNCKEFADAAYSAQAEAQSKEGGA